MCQACSDKVPQPKLPRLYGKLCAAAVTPLTSPNVLTLPTPIDVIFASTHPRLQSSSCEHTIAHLRVLLAQQPVTVISLHA